MNSINFVKKYLKARRIFFTTPSHSGFAVIPPLRQIFGKKFFKYDLSETDGFDDLSDPSGVLSDFSKSAAKKLDAGFVFFLVNGSTSGILAALTALSKPSDKVLVARNCHKSVFNAFALTGVTPVFITPEYDRNIGAFGKISPDSVDKILSENPEIKVFIMTSPTYEGLNSDISAISSVCAAKNVTLVVDEAHGALKNFAPEFFGKSAISRGADVSICSLHKTCGAPNPCALLLLNKNSVAVKDKIQFALNLYNTSSPSYPAVFASFETVNFLVSSKGAKKISTLVDNLQNFRKNVENLPGIRVLSEDCSKILISAAGLSGAELSEKLDALNIEDELVTDTCVLCTCGIGTSSRKLFALEKALRKIAKELTSSEFIVSKGFSLPEPVFEISLRDAIFAEKSEVSLDCAPGKICAKPIFDYPPGIPLVLPGEKFTDEHVRLLKAKDFGTVFVVS